MAEIPIIQGYGEPMGVLDIDIPLVSYLGISAAPRYGVRYLSVLM